MAQTAISTPADGLAAGEIRVPAEGGEMVAYRALAGRRRQPAGDSGGAGNLRRA